MKYIITKYGLKKITDKRIIKIEKDVEDESLSLNDICKEILKINFLKDRKKEINDYL